MEPRDFTGKVVIGSESGRRYVLRQITASYIVASTVEKDAQGNCASYRWPAINKEDILKLLLFVAIISDFLSKHGLSERNPIKLSLLRCCRRNCGNGTR